MEVTVEALATCKKKLTISIPREEIKAKFEERLTELEREAQVPGFRPGRAPRRLVEKRFHKAVADEVRVKLVAEAFEKAIKDENLDVIGEPDLDPDAIKMADDGPLTFSIELEVRPAFELPDYVGIPVSAERPAVTDAGVEQALERLRESRGRLDPVPAEEEVKANDLLVGDLTIQAGETMVVDRQNVRLPVAAIAVEGIRLENLPEVLKGAKAGDTRSTKITIGQDAEREDVRGKEAEVRLKINSAARVALPDNLALLKEMDYEDMESLRAGLRRQLESQSEAAYTRAQEQAIEKWLLEKIPFDLPTGLAARHANQLLQRRLMNLQSRGIPVDEIEKRLGEIKNATTEEADRDLKLHFILDAIAKKEKMEVTDAEVDARVQMIAMQYGRKTDRLHEEMEQQGTLDSLRQQILEDKVVRSLLEKAQVSAPVVEVSAPAGETKAEEKPAEGAAPAPEAKAEEKPAEGAPPAPQAQAEEKPAEGAAPEGEAMAEEKSPEGAAPAPDAKAEEKPSEGAAPGEVEST
jgi:trigger factor